MADVLSTPLMKLHEAIRDQIADQFPDFRTVEFYRDDEDEHLPTPACLLEMEEFELNDLDPGTGQTPLAVRFSAKLIFSRERRSNGVVQLQIREAAAALSAFVNKRCFMPRSSEARLIRAGEDEFTPAVKGKWAVFTIEWLHPECFFGENIWLNNGQIYEEILIPAPDGDGFVNIAEDASDDR